MHVSENVRELEGSATLAVAALCRAMRAEGRHVIDLSAGEPDFRTPEFASQAGVAAINQGFTHYTPVSGALDLRETIAANLASYAGKKTDPLGVVTSTGAKQALFNAIFTLFGTGDRVVIPVPYWTSYPELVKLARATPVKVVAEPAAGFKVTTSQLDAIYDERLRGILINSPANPTGAVYSLDELTELACWAKDRGVWIISDEIYGRICFSEARAPSILQLPEDLLDHTVLIDGASKAFAMTGWRIGFSYSSPALAARFGALQSHITSNPSTPAQYAALAAFRSEPRVERAVNAMVAVFKHRRERVLSLAQKYLPDAHISPPGGAFYLFIRVDNYYSGDISGSEAFCTHVLRQTGVALVPGAAFGDDRFVRLSFAAAEDELAEGIRRMGDLLSVAAAHS